EKIYIVWTEAASLLNRVLKGQTNFILGDKLLLLFTRPGEVKKCQGTGRWKDQEEYRQKTFSPRAADFRRPNDPQWQCRDQQKRKAYPPRWQPRGSEKKTPLHDGDPAPKARFQARFAADQCGAMAEDHIGHCQARERGFEEMLLQAERLLFYLHRDL